jgi:DNA repair photolyase
LRENINSPEKLRKQIELLSSTAEQKINALKELHNAKIPTVLFISPIFPQITDWEKIINKTKSFVDEYWFENLNLYPSIKSGIFRFLRKNRPELVEK